MSEDRIRVIIVDDEPPARDVLREYLCSSPDIDIVAECGNGFEAVKAVNGLAPDVLFLDIQMPKLDGFEVLELLDEHPLVVFVTAYDEYAIRAFAVQALDYLLKPFARDRLEEVLERLRERLAQKEPPTRPRIGPPEPLQRVAIREGAAIHVIPVGRIDSIRAEDDYVRVTTGEQSFLKQERLSDLESRLDPNRFIRVHRSYIVNLERIARVELYAKDSRIAILKSGAKIPVSRAGYARLRELL